MTLEASQILTFYRFIFWNVAPCSSCDRYQDMRKLLNMFILSTLPKTAHSSWPSVLWYWTALWRIGSNCQYRCCCQNLEPYVQFPAIGSRTNFWGMNYVMQIPKFKNMLAIRSTKNVAVWIVVKILTTLRKVIYGLCLRGARFDPVPG